MLHVCLLIIKTSPESKTAEEHAGKHTGGTRRGTMSSRVENDFTKRLMESKTHCKIQLGERAQSLDGRLSGGTWKSCLRTVHQVPTLEVPGNHV